MLSNISWRNYLIGVGILLVLYYLAVLLKFYRKDIRRLFSTKINLFQRKEQNLSVGDAEEEKAAFEELKAVVEDLGHAVLEKAGKEATKEELLEQLRRELANYAGLRKPAYRTAVNNYIIRNAQTICGVVFSEKELDAAWETLPR